MKNVQALVVDDEKNIRLTLAHALEGSGVKTVCAVNGEEALTILKSDQFDLILLDLKMPGIDGIETLRRIRDGNPHVKVVIITAFGTIESAVEAMKLGAADFIQKPFAPKEIRALIASVMDRDALDADKAKGYQACIELAKRCINRQEFDAAAEHVRQAIAADATKPEAFNILGVLHEIGGDKLEAQKNYRTALELDPTYEPAQQNLRRTAGLDRGGRVSLD
ncbi:MAG TPA: response regulator [Candidatus Brocadiia bacterium]|nr:response regulator [Candidatus Brocadiia bacterium]